MARITWTGKYGTQNTTNIVSTHVAAFAADVKSSGGHVVAVSY